MLGSAAAGQTIIRVDNSTSTPGAGAFWNLPVPDLQDAIDTAAGQPYGTVHIWVRATATPYVPTDDLTGNSSPSDPRDKTFRVEPGLEIYGGFDGTEAIFGDRAGLYRQTVLSGDIAGTPTDPSDDVYTVVFVDQDQVPTGVMQVTTVIDGFTVRQGTATGSGSLAFLNERSSGAGMYIYGSPTMVEHVGFFGLFADDLGGGLFFNGVGNSDTIGLNLLDCYFLGNVAHRGGGVALSKWGTS